MKLVLLKLVVAGALLGLPAGAVTAPDLWEEPAASLAGQIADLLGPGQARLTIRNLSTIATDRLPAIRRLLEQDLKTRGVLASGAESANLIRITLSENARERLWVAEIVEGSETKVAMVSLGREAEAPPSIRAGMLLRKEPFLSAFELASKSPIPYETPVLGIAETKIGLAVLRPGDISLLNMSHGGWDEVKTFEVNARQLPKDPRGVLVPSPGGGGFTVYAPGTECVGTWTPQPDGGSGAGDWSVRCRESDDPWPIVTGESQAKPVTFKAFYNAARNYFTGVVTPSLGVDLPAFYSAGQLPRPDGSAFLITGIDGRVQLAEGGKLKTVSGARDWGSDFLVLLTECGSGVQVVASGSGEAASDSLRAYELPGLEAIPVSPALAMDGTVTALWATEDRKSALAAVRRASGEYEVDRVTALCE